MLARLYPQQVYHPCDAQVLACDAALDLALLDEPPGQERAFESLELGAPPVHHRHAGELRYPCGFHKPGRAAAPSNPARGGESDETTPTREGSEPCRTGTTTP